MKYLYTIFLSCLFLTSHAFADTHKAKSVIINNAGETIGEAVYTQGTQGVLIEVMVSNLPPGKHGMHFHEVGTCADHDHFKSAKGHIAPDGKPHGYTNPDGPHAGNLPNLIIHDDGTAHVELYSGLVSLHGNKNQPALLDDDGSTLMIHINEDDHLTQPIGGAGARIACGVIE
jgi:Cu-Zn family superoxide dismutase